MDGVPIVIKEPLSWVGYPSTYGWNYTSAATGGINLYPEHNAGVTQILLDAGAIIMGKTNIPSFSAGGSRANTSWAGPTYNAVNYELVPGASSAGTAMAVAGGFAVWGIAEETGGSIQNPAAAQSLVGVKTTFGLVNTAVRAHAGRARCAATCALAMMLYCVELLVHTRGPRLCMRSRARARHLRHHARASLTHSAHDAQGVTPLAGLTRDVLGPHAKTVEDAAIALNLISGYGTPSFKGKNVPAGGYTGLLGSMTLEGKRVGLYGPGWKDVPLMDEVQALYHSAVAEIEALGATAVKDPFAGTGFDGLSPNVGYDARGYESVAFDFYHYLLDFGITGFDEFKAKVGITPFTTGTPIAGRAFSLPGEFGRIFNASLENPSVKPNLQPFMVLKAKYTKIIADTFAAKNLDVLVYPQATAMLPLLDSDVDISSTTVRTAQPGCACMCLQLGSTQKCARTRTQKRACLRLCILGAAEAVVAASTYVQMPSQPRTGALQLSVTVRCAVLQQVHVRLTCVQSLQVSDINIGGFTLVTVPSTRATGSNAPSPFSLAFIGPQFSEATLLALAHVYEQATHLRTVPELTAFK
jgi:Asp-tRNA(Asn)/Glu-tRNA(Gln) amidotransferase A subunit family amidase